MCKWILIYIIFGVGIFILCSFFLDIMREIIKYVPLAPAFISVFFYTEEVIYSNKASFQFIEKITEKIYCGKKFYISYS